MINIINNILRKIAFYLVVVLFFSIIPAGSHEVNDEHSEFFKTVVVKDGTNLTIAECVALAFKNSPEIKRKKYELDIAKSNLGIAKSAFFPVIGAGAGFYSQNNSNRNLDYYKELPNIAVTVNQLVWDFGKSTANIKMEEFYKIGAEYEFMDSLCETLFNVKEKYYEMLKAQALVQIAKDNIKICEKYVATAKNKPDRVTAELYLKKAKFELCYLENNQRNAKVNLSNAMFLDNAVDYTISNTNTFNYDNDYGYINEKIPQEFIPHKFSFEKDKVMQIAYDSSPDLRVLESTKNAMIQSLKYIKKTYLPELSANAGYGYVNSSELSNNSFQVGVNLSTNVNYMELKNSIKGAEALVKLADNEIKLFKKDLYYRVQRAFNDVEFAADDVPFAHKTARQSLDNIKLVETLYSDGTLNYIALQDARKDYIESLKDYITSIYFYNASLIEVEKAMHYHIVDIHHKTEHAMLKHSDELVEHLIEALNCDEKENINKSPKKKDNL